MSDLSFVIAFAGGALALLSPCSALLLPAFFSATVGTRRQMVAHGGLFYLGLLVTLVPFGLGLGALGSVMHDHWETLVLVTSVVLIVLGAAQIFGKGFDLSRILPGATSLQRRADNAQGILKTVLLGAISGVAGFCAGPILGAILTLTLTQDSLWGAGFLLAMYGAGMVVPLVIIAATWRNLSQRTTGVLRGRSFTIGKREFHTTSVITGLLIMAVGLLFYFTNGLVSAPSLMPSSALAAAQEWVGSNVQTVQLILVVVLAAAALLWWYFRTFPPQNAQETRVPQQRLTSENIPKQPDILLMNRKREPGQ